MGTLPAASVIPREPYPTALAPNPAGSPLEAQCCFPHGPGAREAACLAQGSGSSCRKGLICTVLFGYLNTAVSIGVILGMFILCCERLKTHVSSYSPACLLCLCFHMQHTCTLCSVARLGVCSWQSGPGREKRAGRREALWGGSPHSSSHCTLLASPMHTLPWHQLGGLSRGRGHCVGLV